MQHVWVQEHLQEQLLRDQAALASTLQAKKANAPTSVSITIDCTAGGGGGGSSGNSGSSSNAVSSTGSADSSDTKEVSLEHCKDKCAFKIHVHDLFEMLSKFSA